MAIFALPAHALNLSDCDRTTHISHGGEDGTLDYGNGHVGWIGWWAQEGIFKDVWLADCASGKALSLRTSEERISDRFIPDRTEKARETLAEWASKSAAFFTVDWMAGQMGRFGEDITVATLATEPCACAVAYPALRGDKAAFDTDSLGVGE